MTARTLDAADAVGRERVSETGIDDRAFAAEASIGDALDEAGCEAVRSYLSNKLSDEWDPWPIAVQAIALYHLTAAPPERHDAPGVSFECACGNDGEPCGGSRLTAKRIGDLTRVAISDHNLESRSTYLNDEQVAQFVGMLTGQPDAGAGGE